MRATKAFERELQGFLDEMERNDHHTHGDVRAKIEAAAEAGNRQVEIKIEMGTGPEPHTYERNFRFKAFIDPFSSEDELVLAAEDEKVVEWTGGVGNYVWQVALLPWGPEAHVVTYDPELNHETNPAYLALCKDGAGRVRIERFDEMHCDEALRGACAFAWGLSMDEIEWAQANCYGYLREEVDTVVPDNTEQGHVFKNAFAFLMKNDEICYIPEHGFDNAEQFDGEFAFSECEGYTYQDIVDICEGNEKVAKHVFTQVDWQGPSAYFGEMEPDEIAEIAAGVFLGDGYELLEHKGNDTIYLGDEHLNVPFPVFYAHGAKVDVCYCGDPDKVTNPNDLRIVEADKLPEVGFMTEDKLRYLPIMSVNRSWLDTLVKDSGITVFHEEGPLSIGISYERGAEPEDPGRYIFNLFNDGEYVNITGSTTLAEPWPDEIITEIAAEWNNEVRNAFCASLPKFETPHEIRFVSTTDERLPAFAAIHNVHMQEKATFRPDLLAKKNDPLAAASEASRDMATRNVAVSEKDRGAR